MIAATTPAVGPQPFLAEGLEDSRLWERFVAGHPDGSIYHRWGWKDVIQNAFGWPTYYLMATVDDQVTGILPLVQQKSRIFGNFMTSLPFLNGGGVLTSAPAIERALIRQAIEVSKRVGASYLELRHRTNHQLDLPNKSHKVAVVKAVYPDTERMFQELDGKVRSDVRKAAKNGLTSETGGAELLDEFYPIFARNMRDLGTPVYGKKFFQEIRKAFPDCVYITVVRHRGKAIASSFLTGFRDSVEAGWSSSLSDYLPMKPNMLLYWQNLCLAAEKGYRIFDFGRSTMGSGTHRFKMQWGSQEIPLFWDYWLADGQPLPELNPQNRKYQIAIRMWQRLPLWVSNLIGPRIVRCLP